MIHHSHFRARCRPSLAILVFFCTGQRPLVVQTLDDLPLPSKSANSSREIHFAGNDGENINLTGTGGSIEWCTTRAGCQLVHQLLVDLDLDASGSCRLRVSAPEANGSRSMSMFVTQPPLGLEQQHLAGRLFALARGQGLQVRGTALQSLEETAAVPPAVHVREPLAELPVLVPSTSPSLLRLPGTWAGVNLSQLQVALVETPGDCGHCAFIGSCQARALVSPGSPSETLDVELPHCRLLSQPPGSGPNHTAAAVVCLRADTPSQALLDVLGLPQGNVGNTSAEESQDSISGASSGDSSSGPGPFLAVLGRLVHYPPPRPRFLEGNVGIGVRTFLNPGWRQDVAIQCENCSRLSRLAVRAIVSDLRCKGLAQQTLSAVAAAKRDGQIPEYVDMRNVKNGKLEDIVKQKGVAVAGLPCALPPTGPCAGRADAAFSFGDPQVDPAGNQEGTFTLEGSRRLGWKERQALFHHRSALCFYPTGNDPNGWLVGFAAVHMDGGDLQSFIGFVCFFGVALPLICLVTALLHYNKYERCKQHVSQVRLEYQREQLERELATRRTRSSPASTAGGSGSLPMLTPGVGSSGTPSASVSSNPIHSSTWSGSAAFPSEGYWPLAGHASQGLPFPAASSSSAGTRRHDSHFS